MLVLNSVKLPWLKFVHKSLDNLGMSNLWLNNIATNLHFFKNLVKTRLRDQYAQEWSSCVNDSGKCLNYKMYKHTFKFEQYLDILPPNLANILLRFRCTNHKLPIEEGRFHNTPRVQRTCKLCNSNALGDEFHYLFECSILNDVRKKYIPRYYRQNPNAIKFESLMNSDNKKLLTKLSLFCKHIMSLFN